MRQKNARTPLSQVFDDKSVLENMHCMLIVQLLRKHGFGFLLSPSTLTSNNPARRSLDTKGFRKVLYSSVLATDMSLHFAWVQNLKEFGAKISRGELKRRLSSEDAEADRITICQALIKCADISNPVSQTIFTNKDPAHGYCRLGLSMYRSTGRQFCSKNGLCKHL